MLTENSRIGRGDSDSFNSCDPSLASGRCPQRALQRYGRKCAANADFARRTRGERDRGGCVGCVRGRAGRRGSESEVAAKGVCDGV